MCISVYLYMYIIVYRTISRGRRVANRQFVVTSLAEIVRSWWKHPKIAELLRYGGEYKCRDNQYDVQDGDLWKELMAGATVHDLAWGLVNDGIETQGRFSANHSVIPRTYGDLNGEKPYD